ncbi:MAG: DUF2064 domain-containing protein [Turneriella sp.]|nr:DUF2064 domain-containing protein [Turneriella sp.]
MSEDAALEIYRWLLRVQSRAMAASKNKQHAFNDYIYFAPGVSRLAARFRFSPDLAGLRFCFRAQGEGDWGARLRQACTEVLRYHDMVMVWAADIPALPAGIFDQAGALYPQSVVTLARAGGAAFLSLAAEKFTPAVFEHVRWNTPAAGADQLRALRNAGISPIVRGKVTRLDQTKDFTRMLRELEAEQRTADLEDFRQTIQKITEQ